jgi:hypothetical protein
VTVWAQPGSTGPAGLVSLHNTNDVATHNTCPFLFLLIKRLTTPTIAKPCTCPKDAMMSEWAVPPTMH